MRTIIREHSRSKLEQRIEEMKKRGWKQKSDIIYDDHGFKYGTITHLCVMERDDKK